MAHCSVIGALFRTVIVPFTSSFVTKTHGISSSLTKKQHTKHLLKFNQIHGFCAPIGPKLFFKRPEHYNQEVLSHSFICIPLPYMEGFV